MKEKIFRPTEFLEKLWEDALACHVKILVKGYIVLQIQMAGYILLRIKIKECITLRYTAKSIHNTLY